MRISKAERSALGAMMNALRKTRAGGRPKKLSPCPKGCGLEFGAREIRAHAPLCTGAKPKRQRKDIK
jgi:hypothetical protein